MKVTVLVVGRVRPPLLASVVEYETRAKRYWKLEVVEVDAGAGGRNAAPDRVMAAEQERLLARIPDEVEVIALTRVGEAISSAELSRYLGSLAVRGSQGVAFVVGGAYGLGAGVLERAKRRLSLSAFTLPHELARLMLAEQLYRAGTLLRGEPYHKGGDTGAF